MIHIRLRAIVAAASLVALAACSSPTEPLAVDPDQPGALARARARWATAGIHDYAYDIGRHGMWFNDSLHVEVRGDLTVSVVRITPPPSLLGGRHTVPALFDSIEEAIGFGSETAVSYDPQLGFPISISLPDPPGWADFGWTGTVANFQAR